MNEEVSEKLNKYFTRSFPELKEDYEIIIKPILAIDLNNNESVKNLINAIYLVFLSKEPDSTSKLRVLIRQFCSLLKETDEVEEIETIYLGVNKKLPVPNAEIILQNALKDLNYKVNLKFRAGNKKYTLGELNLYLQDSKRKIMDIFFRVYERNNINIPFQLPNFSAMGGVQL